MELSNYELVRYPSGQLIITRIDAAGAGFRDVVGVYASEKEAQVALDRLTGTAPRADARAGRQTTHG
jgi:hypothetical protein